MLSERTNVPKKVGFEKRTVSAPDPPSAASTARIRPASAAKGADDPDQTISTTAPTPLSARERPERSHPRGSSLNFVKEEEDAPSTASSVHTDGPGWGVVEELRREIGNLQMDMLRMGRGLKVSFC